MGRVPRSAHELRDDALAIWRAGVDAVRPERLLPTHVSVDGDTLRIGGLTLSLADLRRIVVVGAGKAGGGMVRAIDLDTLKGEILHIPLDRTKEQDVEDVTPRG